MEPIYIRGVGTATPAACYTTAQCLGSFQQSDWYARLDECFHLIARTVLQRDKGIETCSLVVDSLDEVFQINYKLLAKRFRQHPPTLAIQAGQGALALADLELGEVGAGIESTCTGYLCLNLSGYVIEVLGLCSVARTLPNLQLGHGVLASLACAHLLLICVEVSIADICRNCDVGMLISACSFGDGTGDAVLDRTGQSSNPVNAWILHGGGRDVLRALEGPMNERATGLFSPCFHAEVSRIN